MPAHGLRITTHFPEHVRHRQETLDLTAFTAQETLDLTGAVLSLCFSAPPGREVTVDLTDGCYSHQWWFF